MVGALSVSIPGIALPVFGEEGWLAALTIVRVGVHAGALLTLRAFPSRFRPIVYAVFAADVAFDLADTFLLGGLIESGLQVLWSLIVVLGALVALTLRDAVFWFIVFLAQVVVAASASSLVEPVYELDDPRFDAAFSIFGTTILIFAVMAYFVRQRDRFQRQSDDLLHNILPDAIADRLKEDSGMIADQHEQVTVLFADVVGFAPLSATLSATELVGMLNEVFVDIDRFVSDVGLEKIKTVGDEYMVAAGVPVARPDHAQAAAEVALRIRDHAAVTEYRGRKITFRIGINSGPVVAGIIGERKFAYDLWGDVVNLASRMESHGEPGAIQITESTYQLIKQDFVCEERGKINVKGKGALETWFLLERRQPAR